MKYMIKNLSKILILPLLVAVLLFEVQVYADEGTDCQVFIPVEVQNIGSNIPTGINSTIEIQPENQQNPMPDAREIIIADSGKSQMGPIKYTVPGVYKYFITQKAGEDTNFLYDETCYTLTIRIYDDGQGNLKYELFAVKGESTGKVAEILFTNSYKEPAVTETLPETENLEKETNEPESYTKQEGNSQQKESSIEEITNKETIAPKTGERAIPAIIVGMLGLVMLILCIVLYRKKQENKG